MFARMVTSMHKCHILILEQPTALIAFCTFIPAYVRRDSLDDLPYWLIFMMVFIVDTVGSVMNAYNNITWVGYFPHWTRTKNTLLIYIYRRLIACGSRTAYPVFRAHTSPSLASRYPFVSFCLAG